MKPAWDSLSDAYAVSSSVLVADVDCTTDEGKAVCSKFGVNGYPTIKYYKDGDREGQDYSGGRDLSSLTTFVKENLEILCDVASLEGCDEREQAFIEKMKAKGAEAITKEFLRLQGMVDKPMKAELKGWLYKRINTLTGLKASTSSPVKEEL